MFQNVRHDLLVNSEIIISLGLGYIKKLAEYHITKRNQEFPVISYIVSIISRNFCVTSLCVYGNDVKYIDHYIFKNV